jgi:PIN domain nuclease of toxin-antitoxin system
MKILVDTHIYLWMLSFPEKLGTTRRYELENPANEVFLSVMSIAELMIKHSIGKIDIGFLPVEKAEAMGLEILAFSGPEALLLKDLPLHHKDPFDRMLIVQSIHLGLKLMTDDEKFKKYDCKII